MTTVRDLEQQQERLSQSYASARNAADWEGCELIRCKYRNNERLISTLQLGDDEEESH